MSDDPRFPTVTLELTYDQALRLSYMARFPHASRPGDDLIADNIDASIKVAENDPQATPDQPGRGVDA